MKKIDKKTFGEFVKERRQLLGYTQEQLAEQLHVSVHVVSKWEIGVRYPNFEMAEALADALGVSVQELFDKSKVEVISGHVNPGLVAIGVAIVSLCIGGILITRYKVRNIEPADLPEVITSETQLVERETTTEDREPETTENSTDTQVGVLKKSTGIKAYDTILQQILNGKLNNWSAENYKSANLVYVWAYGTIGYCVKDVDGDGVKELLFGDLTPDAYSITNFYQMFTLVGDQAVQVFQGGERDRYYICSNGYMCNEGSSGAGYSDQNYYQFDGKKLAVVQEFAWHNTDADFSEALPWARTLYGENGTTTERLSAEDVKTIFTEYQGISIDMTSID